MERRFLAWIGYGLIGLAILALCVSLLRVGAAVVDADKRGGDLATWVGALFSGAAFAGTIGLYLQERRRIRSERVLDARLTAASFQLRVVNAQFALKNTAKELERFISINAGLDPIKKSHDFLSSTPIWTAQDALPIQFYDPVLTLTLIEFMTQFELARLRLKSTLDEPDRDRVEQILLMAGLKQVIEASIKSIEGKAEECQRAGHKIYSDAAKA